MSQIINSMIVYTQGSKKYRPIVFVHGFPFDNTMWKNQISALRNKYYCVTYDIRGLGESYTGDGQYTMEAYVADLISIIHKLELDKPVLCGLSMGGYISLRAVEKHQSLFGGLILLDTKSEADDDKGKLVRAEKINQINTDGLDPFIDGFVNGLFCDLTHKEKSKIVKSTLENCKKNNPLHKKFHSNG